MSIKKLFVATLLCPMIFSSCGKNSSDDVSKTPATDLSKAIDKAIADKNFELAYTLFDSLNNTYPDSLDLRKKTILQKAEIAQGVALRDIPLADADIANLTLKADSLEKFFRTISVSAATGSYLLEKSLNPSDLQSGRSAIQPRVGNTDMPWMINVCTSGNINPYKITLLSPEGNELVSATDQLDTYSTAEGGIQTVTFTSEHCGPIARALENAASLTGYSLLISGHNGTQTVKLTPSAAQAIIRSYQLGTTRSELRRAYSHREAIERRLLVARNQKANLQ